MVPHERKNKRSNGRTGTAASLSERPSAAGTGAASVQPQQVPMGWPREGTHGFFPKADSLLRLVKLPAF